MTRPTETNEDRREANKRVVERFFEQVPNGTVDGLGVLDELVAEDYVQHNPHAAPGRDGLREFFSYILTLPVSQRITYEGSLAVNLIAEDDFVVRQDIRTNGMLIDIFRLEDGLLKEHWDAFRQNPGEEPIPGL
jgi:predicted SnoaL-like aldol condensation-catalyzing enzyme